MKQTKTIWINGTERLLPEKNNYGMYYVCLDDKDVKALNKSQEQKRNTNSVLSQSSIGITSSADKLQGNCQKDGVNDNKIGTDKSVEKGIEYLQKDQYDLLWIRPEHREWLNTYSFTFEKIYNAFKIAVKSAREERDNEVKRIIEEICNKTKTNTIAIMILKRLDLK